MTRDLDLRLVGAVAAASLAIAAAALLYLPPHAAAAVALTAFGIGLWTTGALPEYFTALAVFSVAMILRVAPAQTVFSGFESTTFWLVFGSMISGVAIRRTGLGARMAWRLAGAVGTSYAGAIAGVVLLSVLLGFVMPSAMGRSVLIVPIAAALADRLGFVDASNGRLGVLLAAVFGSNLPSFAILPANVPNMILAGSAETLYQHPLSYGQYLLLHFPVLGLLKSVLLIVLVVALFPDDSAPIPDRQEHIKPLSREERRLAWVLAVTVALWLSDGLHHISPAWVSLGSALYCLWPGSGLTSRRSFNEELNYGSLFYIAGIMGLGAILAHSGVGPMLVQELGRLFGLAHQSRLHDVLALASMSSLVGLVTTLPGVPAVMTPLSQALSRQSGLSLETVLMTQVLGFSSVLLPYQSPPLMVALQLGKIPLRAATRLCLALFALTVMLLLPLDMLWWRFLGLL